MYSICLCIGQGRLESTPTPRLALGAALPLLEVGTPFLSTVLILVNKLLDDEHFYVIVLRHSFAFPYITYFFYQMR